MPNVLHFAVDINAALGQRINSHVHQHGSEDIGSTLRNHQCTSVGGNVGVPGADEDAGILCFLELLVQAGSINRGDADCINALVDSLLDQLQLSGHVCGGSADVVNSQTPISGVLLSAIVGGLKERVAGNLRDEGHGHAIHRALALGKSGGAQRQSHAKHQKHRQNLFHSFGFLL